ncbi:exodeoxyribonuclease VIII [Enterobacter cloacae]|uniref:Putative exodeoxyribonuclease VIII n=1 Tax=Enterobacter cloacae subsp. cloacae (strain ATCC 13047 / DSM 30054 / NBRC 13535 / NCTC 10005 / WDCM 00083 / NCDC 279-56) TaxID=716541 RepID=A0A0H3CKX8_ENTCC|nr:exodeoxyribonuclease VIII [Enterobacter cloacae]ADF61218.1 putative exodeoxyribonuclease VIII [Enterobacter cloacae subsp. cloacae ATCC 13047]KGB12638.1 putative exodeoxyribonuclease VIII [Enterobacter cloacae]OOC92075.1 exodeoxyribonuclease VIII [Enterobacter cloacae]QLA64562.1 exodeoxyribonuclease VIII [Enterobacter cloacae]QWZ88282.1 exodeoxyribonuclease VIII [Enterobacter cloacae]
MSVELKVFGGAYFPKDKALKKHPDLKPLATAVNAATKAIAEAVIFGKLAAEHPEHIDDYFKVKIWEHREELPCPDFDVFSSEFFESVAVWNVNAGEPAAAPQPEAEAKEEWEDNKTQEEIKIVAQLDLASRAACLALFGPVPGITSAQYGQIVDLKNDDEPSFARELAEALAKERRALELAPERQEQLLSWLRENTKESAQWPDIKKQIAKWIDTPVDKRPQSVTTTEENRTDTGSTLGGGNKTDRSPDLVHNLSTLRIEVAVAILSMYDEIDIYWIPNKYMIPAKAMAEAEQDPRFTAWWKKLRSTPGILDYSRAAIIALIKSAPEDLWIDPVALREYINRELVECDHANPDQKTVEIACRPKPRTNSEKKENDETESTVPGETELPAVCPGKAAQLEKELNETFAHSSAPEQQTTDQPRMENLGGGVFSVEALINNSPSNEVEKQEVPPAPNDREIAILHALNDLISGRTNIMGKEEAEGVVACAGQLVSDVVPLLMEDITATEFCLSPDFTDEEIHDVATTMLDRWSDDVSVRQKIALDAIVEYRRPAPPKSVVLDPPAVTANPIATPDPAPETNAPLSSVTYLQQLTIAALQGLCSNPAYCNQYEEFPAMAAGLARSVINHQEGSCASD